MKTIAVLVFLLFARMLGEELAKGWKQPVVIDNRPGAGAILGSDSVAKAPADGYTVYIATLGALALNPHLYKKLPYDPVKSVPELIAHAKANPGKLNFGAGASFAQLLGAAFNRRAGTDIVNVSYRGVQQAVTDFLAGQVQLLFADPRPSTPAYVDDLTKSEIVKWGTLVKEAGLLPE